MRQLIAWCWPLLTMGQALTPGLPDAGVIDLGTDSFYDPAMDYSRFRGRATDRNRQNNIFKIVSENKNIKLFKPGDPVTFQINNLLAPNSHCQGLVRGVEQRHFVLFIPNLANCLGQDGSLRRGTQMSFHSKILAQRVVEASQFRATLIERRKDFLHQLNDINNFFWSFEQSKIQTIAKYDMQILALEKNKEYALDELRAKQKDQQRLQRELIARLDQLDLKLKHYRISPLELLRDRWSQDHDLGKPVGPRPMPLKDQTQTSTSHLSQKPPPSE